MSTKRRANNGGAPERPLKEQKRRRVSIYTPETNETPERTTRHGLEILDKIKTAVDKYGQPIATEFLELPDGKEYPEYYLTIRLPIALDIIEKKLRNHGYTQLTSLEADLRRMVSNAKFYNEKSSLLFSNAERIRKIVVAEMPKVNPAYKDPNYAPFSTPLPNNEVEEEDFIDELPEGEEESENEAEAEAEAEVEAEPEPTPREERTRSSRRAGGRISTIDRDQNQTDARKEDPDAAVASKFQAALEGILNEAIRMQDEDGEEKFAPFINLPDKHLYKEYYDVIDHPVSLRGILRTVRGTDRRKPTTSKSKAPNPFRSWKAFIDEVNYLWTNARIFNEDESDIAILAGELEKFINTRIAETRKTVPAPEEESSGTGGGTKIRLKLGAATSTPEPPAAPTASKLKLRLPARQQQTDTASATSKVPGVRVDTEALKRQQELVRAGTNGIEVPKPTTNNVQATPTRTLRDRTGSARAPVATASPAPISATVNGTGAAPATNGPSLWSRTPLTRRAEAELERETAPKPETSAKPSPSLQAAQAVTPTPAPAAPEPPAKSTSTGATALSTADWEKLSQARNKAYGNGLISQISISSHSSLPLRQPFHISPPCSPVLPSQPISLTLPSCINLISFNPIIASSSHRRPTQHYFTVCDQKNPTPPTTSVVPFTDYTRFAYDVRLREGVNKLVVGVSGKADGETTERVIVFVNLLRS
ncbi:hypothetical protein H106_06374 [Trichophyton rubrum CBS 735.88]|nr:hypothetical protein H106_06374 [Trichophyton rubrum CBS 735.88]